METAWNDWTGEIARQVSRFLDAKVEPSEIVVSPDARLGDLSFGCFRLAKERKKNPAELAQEIAKAFSLKGTDVDSVNAAGPYVNFTLATGPAVSRVISDIESSDGRYGFIITPTSPDPSSGRRETNPQSRILLEYAQPNTHKELHVGHLRNLMLGVALNRILTHAGWLVIPMSYHGDVGAHVAKCLWRLVSSMGYPVSSIKKEDVGELLARIPERDRTGRFLGKMYAEGNGELEADPDLKEEISDIQRKLEAHDPVWEALWRETRRWSLEEIAAIFDELGVEIERQYLESEVADRGQEMVDELIKKGVAKESLGAMVVDLEDANLGVFLIRKSDGTSLYATKDLALAELKLKEYPKAARSLILVDNRQAHYFRQLFETLRRMKLEPVPEFVGYEFLTLTSGAMSSRAGNIVTFQDFRDEVLAYAKEEVRQRHADWNEEKIEKTARAIAMAGMKFGMLKQDSDKVFTFDLGKALSFDGATGPYVQYAATRLGSILRKDSRFKIQDSSPLTRAFDHPSEKALAMVLAVFPARVETAAKEMRPAVVAQWCLDAARAVNDFYRDVPVLESSADLGEGRLRLVAAARDVLTKGLDLLGIPLPDEM